MLVCDRTFGFADYSVRFCMKPSAEPNLRFLAEPSVLIKAIKRAANREITLMTPSEFFQILTKNNLQSKNNLTSQ